MNGHERPDRLTEALFGGTGRIPGFDARERDELERVELLLTAVLSGYRSRWYRASGPEEAELAAAMAPYEEELRGLVRLTPEDRARIIRDYPALADRVARDAGSGSGGAAP